MSVQAGVGMEEKTHLLAEPVVRFPERPPYRDVPFLVLYAIHYLALVALIGYGATLPALTYGAPTDEFWLVQWLGSLHGRHLLFAVLLLFICSSAGVLFSLFMVALLRSSAVAVVWASAVCSVLITVSWCIYAFVIQAWWMGALFLVLAVLNGLFLVVCYARIPFTAQLLTTVAHVAKVYPGLIIQSLVTLMGWFGYLIFWSLACLYSARIEVLQGWQLIPMLLFLFWSQQVFQNFSHTVAAGIVGTWYFVSPTPESAAPGATLRAATTSLGSICFGSLIVGVIKTLRAVATMLLMTKHEIICFIVRLVLSILDALVQWFNT
jgi:hypothetical protein